VYRLSFVSEPLASESYSLDIWGLCGVFVLAAAVGDPHSRLMSPIGPTATYHDVRSGVRS